MKRIVFGNNDGVKFILGIVLIVTIMIVAIVAVASWKTVPAGYKGVVTDWGRVTGMKTNAGFVTPFTQDVVLMPISTQIATVSEEVATNEQQAITATVSVNYKLNAGHVDDIYVSLGREYEDTVVLPALRDALKTITPDYTIDEFTDKRAEIKTRVTDLLDARVNRYHIIIESVNIENWGFPESVDKAIEEKQIARQEALEAEYKLEKDRIEAQREVIIAEATKNATIITAEADAEKVRLEADAKAYSIKVQMEAEAKGIQQVTASLTDEYVELQQMQQWNGELPQIVGTDVMVWMPLSESNTVESTDYVQETIIPSIVEETP